MGNIWHRLWNMRITYDNEKDKWFLIGLATGSVATLTIIGLVLGWWN